MSYTLKTNLANKSNYGGSRALSDIKYIVVHYTANDGDTDENNGKYFANNVVKASAHYFVDDDSVTQSVPDNCIAWHCGATKYKHASCRNANSIGVELCDDVKNGKIYPSTQTIENALELVESLMKKYNVPKANVIRHYDVTGKLCPAYWCGTTAKDAKWKTEFWNKLGASKPATTATAAKVTHTKIKGGYLYEIPFSMIERVEYCPMDGKRGETVTSAAKRIKWNGRSPDIITNAELFSASYAAASGVVNDGVNVMLPEQYGIAFQDKKTPVFSYKNNVKAPDWLGAYPVLVKGGKVGFTAVPSGLGGNRARTCLGTKDNVFGVLVIPEQSGSNDATLQDVAKVFVDRGYNDAINLDGGGSTAYQTPEYGYEQNRKVRGFVCVWYKGGKGNKASKSASTTGSTSTAKLDAAQSFLKSYAKTYKVTASSLNMRTGASTSKPVIKSLSKGAKFICYGYYTKQSDGTVWLLGVDSGGATGYCSKGYLA